MDAEVKPGDLESKVKDTSPIGLESFPSAQAKKTSGNSPEQQFFCRQRGNCSIFRQV